MKQRRSVGDSRQLLQGLTLWSRSKACTLRSAFRAKVHTWNPDREGAYARGVRACASSRSRGKAKGASSQEGAVANGHERDRERESSRPDHPLAIVSLSATYTLPRYHSTCHARQRQPHEYTVIYLNFTTERVPKATPGDPRAGSKVSRAVKGESIGVSQ
jgi:hypothetical protein